VPTLRECMCVYVCVRAPMRAISLVGIVSMAPCCMRVAPCKIACKHTLTLTLILTATHPDTNTHSIHLHTAHTNTHTCTCTRSHTHTHIHTRAHMHTHLHTYTRTHMQTCYVYLQMPDCQAVKDKHPPFQHVCLNDLCFVHLFVSCCTQRMSVLVHRCIQHTCLLHAHWRVLMLLLWGVSLCCFHAQYA
jgi:hypothetical protein